MTIEKRMFDFFIWILALTGLLVLLTSCSPFEGISSPPAAQGASSASKAAPIAVASPRAANTPAPVCTVRTGITAGALNLRSGAGVQFGVIRVLEEGEILDVLERAAVGTSTWLQVTTPAGLTGWVNGSYCR